MVGIAAAVGVAVVGVVVAEVVEEEGGAAAVARRSICPAGMFLVQLSGSSRIVY